MAEQGQNEPNRAVGRTLAETLWFPIFFFVGFLLCYLLAFHQPVPHDVRVAVADPGAAATIGDALGTASPGAFDIVPVPSADAARQAVLHRDTAAAFVTDPAHSTLFVAKANGFLLESVLTQVFTPIAARTGGALTVVDLAPTVSGDPQGTSIFYLALVWNLPSYIVVMMLLRAVTLSRFAKVVTLLGFGAFLSVGGYYGALAMHVIPNDPRLIPLAFLLSIGISLTSLGLLPFAKQLFPGVAMGLFVLLSIPASGGAIPIQLMPAFFRALHPYLPMGNLIEAARGIFYFPGADIRWPIIVLGAWVLAGLVLIAVHALWQKLRAGRTGVEPVAEPPVEDPAIEMPRPTALPTHSHHFGDPEPMVTGTIRTADGDPLRRAIVTVTDGRGHQLVRTIAEDDGSYAVGGLPEQFVDVVVSAPERQSAVRRVPLREGITRREDFALAERRQPVPVIRDA